MNGYGALAGKYLKQQKRRTVLTIVGILLSVALISALGTMGQSMKDNLVDKTVYDYGAFHIGYGDATPELLETLQHHALIKKAGAIRKGEVTPLAKGYELQLAESTTAGFELAPIHLLKGRFPSAAGEAVVEEWALTQLPGAPGLDGRAELVKPDGSKQTYTIVGVLNNQRTNMTYGTGAAYAWMDDAAALADVVPGTNLSVAAVFKRGVDISSHLPEFEKLSPKTFGTNAQLLALKGETSDRSLNLSLIIIFSVLIGLVVLSTIAVIYNAFNIAVLERMRHFGLLRTIGATPSQLRGIVFREAGLLALYGIPAGLLVGCGGLWLVLEAMSAAGFNILTFDGFKLTLHAWILVGSAIVGLLAVMLAAWLPALKASRVSPVDAVRGTGNIVRDSYKRVRLPSVLRLLGIEGDMASKNIRRNRSKFRITAFSIVVSITLFIVFHYFAQEAFKVAVDDSRDDQVAYQLLSAFTQAEDVRLGSPAQDLLDAKTIADIEALPGVAHVYERYHMPDAQVYLPSAVLNRDYLSRMEEDVFAKSTLGGEEIRIVPAYTTLYDEERMKQAEPYLIAGTADPAKLSETNSVLIVQKVKPYVEADNKKYNMELASLAVGDKLSLNFGTQEQPLMREVRVGGILSQAPFSPTTLGTQLYVIGTKTTYAALLKGVPAETAPNGTALRGLDIALADGADGAPVKQALQAMADKDPSIRLVDFLEEQRQVRQFNLQMRIFIYGFLGVIALIGSLNIVNTVQTNLMLRRREFGLLQAVGMTMGQLRRMATLEGVWFGVIGAFWGLLLGIGISYLLYYQLNNMEGMAFSFPVTGAIISCVFALGVGLLSVQGPLRKIAKASVVEELREEA
ncbi:putative ABC transport system permease protein [Cohnella sp. OV330]|uniref:ABC transporter permease n=1 Tax=Cohnella sp. OV330 TaxID=1855288 RepID=UPI0008E9D857|nr:ABC transporter permease [Cohnella sp. OV330]SFB59961.1 putative ABC transport system permease protein [Cohnella sp. OV330]